MRLRPGLDYGFRGLDAPTYGNFGLPCQVQTNLASNGGHNSQICK